MKRMIFLAATILATVSMVGCACYPGYRYGGYGNSCGPIGCGTPGVGVVDYVDGGPGAGNADCGGGQYGGGYYGGCGPMYGSCTPCLDVINCVGNTVRIVGEGALTLVAAPFVLAGRLICAGCNGYESYPNCGCSNEVYYGDNCYQPHDVCDPCACGNGGCTTGSTGCSRCNGGYTEGIQSDDSAMQRPVQPNVQPQRIARPTQQNVRPVSYNRPMNQQPMYQQPARLPAKQSYPVQRLSAVPATNVQGGWSPNMNGVSQQ